jgi:hypothetical protein
MMKSWLFAVLLLGALAVPAAADTPNDNPLRLPPDLLEDLKRAEEAMKRGLATMRESVDLLLRAVPQYEMPRLNDEGDIIIKCRKPEENRGIAPRRSGDAI